jgi:hypothetical protein
MLNHGFDMHRVYISAPGDLEEERAVCRAVIAETNAKEAMPSKILLVSVGLPMEEQILNYRTAVAQNIRQCAYYIQVFQDEWGPSNLCRKMFYLAYDQRKEADLPMQEVVVFLKDAPRETDASILAFRKELEDLADVRVFRFENPKDMKAQLSAVTSGWVREIQSSGTAGA